MSSKLLKIYHRLPSRARNAVATLRGWYLRRSRYGKSHDALTAEARERDHWTAQQWETWREERIAYVLHRAATHVPFYRAQWEARRRRGDRAAWDVLSNWPLLEKSSVRADPRQFLADDCDPRRMFREHTSGTTGTPVIIWRSRTALEQLYAIVEQRTSGWEYIPRGIRWARLGGQLVTPVRQRRPPFWVWNAAMKQLYLSSYHLAPDLIPYYLDALLKYRIAYLAGYPSSLYAIAQEALRLGYDLPMLAVHTNAEPLLGVQRETIATAFNCPVRETYGMAESVAAASECASGTMHQWPEFGHVELMPDGELVCTGLLNTDMPLIRYRVGDRGNPPTQVGTCACGRSLPPMGAIDGRRDDVLVTPDGRLVGRLDPVFKGTHAIREAQIIQEALDHVRVLLAPAPGFTKRDETEMVDNLLDRMGDVRITVEHVDVLPRTANGKVRAVVCNVPAEVRASALQQRARKTRTSSSRPSTAARTWRG
jgi:phenylacetate-CoA ligase